MKKLIFLWSVIIIVFSLTSCSNTDPHSPRVNSVSVGPSVVYLTRGLTRQFYAHVITENNPEGTVMWSVLGGSPDTSINSQGILTISKDETAEILYVEAVYSFDKNKKGISTVHIIHDGAVDMPFFESEYEVEIIFLLGIIAGYIYYNSPNDTKPESDPIILMRIGFHEIPLRVTWYGSYYFFSADGPQQYPVGENMSIFLTTYSGEAEVKMVIPHFPEILNFYDDYNFYTNEDIVIEWLPAKDTDYQSLSFRIGNISVELNLDPFVNTFVIPADQIDLYKFDGSWSLEIINYFYQIDNNTAFVIQQFDFRAMSTTDDTF
ncbi:MAG: hypothetical protein FWG98_12685 [Candidatus Cloacimonetes bacterium]|nr:hypothetical protein [Candidatus Cloacimonadota bacterium]